MGAIETIKSFQAGQFGACTPTQQKVLEMMVRSHQSTLQMVETLLDVYRNDAEGLKLQLTSVNLVSLAEEDRTVTAEIRAAFENQPTVSNPAEALANPLTTREQEILASIAAGKSNHQISQLLWITIGR